MPSRITIELTRAEVDLIERALDQLEARNRGVLGASYATAAQREVAHRDGLLIDDIKSYLA